MATLNLDKISKVYDRARERAVDTVTMHIDDGEIIALLGSSGCGKTTSLRMVAGLESVSRRRDPCRRPTCEHAQSVEAQRRHGL